MPYIFISDSSMIANQVFVPSKENPQLSEMYYKVILNKYFGENEEIFENFSK